MLQSGVSSPRWRTLGALILMCALVSPVGWPTSASAVSEARLNRILRALTDSDLRVRVQALIVLARLKDKRSLSPIVRVLLRDKSASCRALAAVALGNIGDPRAIPPLSRMRSDPARRVRRQVKLALARLAPRRPPPTAPKGKSKARILVRLGSMGARSRRNRRLKGKLRNTWARQVVKSRDVGLISRGQRATARQKVFKVNSSITRFSRIRQGGTVQTTCTISVVVDYRGSIVMMTSGGATVEVSASRFRRSDAERVERSVLETAVASAHKNLVRYLRRH